MAAVRLRKAFRYPEDSDGEHDREELDEEEQEQVIKRLQALENKRNARYSVQKPSSGIYLQIIFATIPLVSAAAFLPSILYKSSTLYERLLCLLGIVSLTTTAYAMRHLSLQQSPQPSKGEKGSATAWTVLYLIPINATVCALLALVYCFSQTTGASFNVRPALYVVPGAMLMAILLARKIMLSVDTTSLEKLRYDYKGV